MSDFIIGCGYNPSFSKNTLLVPSAVSWMELGIKQYLELHKQPELLNLNFSLHIARSPITESKSNQLTFIKYIATSVLGSSNQIGNLSSIGFHLSGPRGIGIGQLGFTSHFDATKSNIQNAINFVVLAQSELHSQIWIENANFYSASLSDITCMWQAVTEICDVTNCGLIIDLAHMFINLSNARVDPAIVLGLIPWEHVKEIHLSGIVKSSDGVYHDGHSQPVSEEIWTSLEKVLGILIRKNIRPIITIEHTDLIWEQKIDEFNRDFDKLQIIISNVGKTEEIKTINSDYYATGYIIKYVQQRYASLVAFMQKMDINVNNVVCEWIDDFKSKGLRLTFDIYEIVPNEREAVIEISDFVTFVEKKYVIRH